MLQFSANRRASLKPREGQERRFSLVNMGIKGSGYSRMKKLGGHCGAKEKSWANINVSPVW